MQPGLGFSPIAHSHGRRTADNRKLTMGRLFLCLLAVLGTACFGDDPTPEKCELGTRGCPCRTGSAPCHDPDLICTSGLICDDDCEPGTTDCRCREGRCDRAGDVCSMADICEAPAFTPSEADCMEDDDCDRGGHCWMGVCTDPCAPGDHGCECFDDGSCSPGLFCLRSTCIRSPSEVLDAPAKARCFTPCQESFIGEEGFRECSAEGLMEGCVGAGHRCIGGTCAADGANARSCSRDVDCPDFQACYGGTCKSGCEEDDDCGSGLICRRKVCQIPCQTSEDASCTDGHYCASRDGENGGCAPLAAAVGRPVTGGDAEGVLSVSALSLQFSNVKPQATFTVENEGATAVRVQVVKTAERIARDDGQWTVETENPISWVRIDLADDCGASSPQDSFEAYIEAGATLELAVCETANPDRANWDGTIEVQATGRAAQAIDLSFATEAWGRWTGSMHRLANFEDAGLSDDTDLSCSATDLPRNALVRRLVDFKCGRIPLAEFQAILSATVEGSWDWPNVRARCEQKAPGGACFLYDNIDGLATYTRSLAEAPVPGGVVSLPFAMNINEGDGSPCEPVTYHGKIDSAATLHFPGDPEVSVVLARDPQACPVMSSGGSDAAAMDRVDVTGLEATSAVGGRYLTTSSDATCAGGNGRFRRRDVPWLVPGFRRNTSDDVLAGQRNRHECLESTFPLPDDEQTNLELAAANPVPDGRPRLRTLEAIDGIMLNQQTLVVLVKEEFVGFDPQGDSFAGYALLMLEHAQAELRGDDFAGNPIMAMPDAAAVRPGEACSPGVLSPLGLLSIDPVEADAVVADLLGSTRGGSEIDPATEVPHYLCLDPDGGAYFDGHPNQDPPCPEQSTLTYFTLQQSGGLQAEPCQVDGTCQLTLNEWIEGDYGNIRLDPAWSCSDPTGCSSDRASLLADRIFYAPTTEPILLPVDEQVEQAFAYKSRFRGREGLGIGFTPEICTDDVAAIPYCYAPAEIERLAGRFDCLASIYRRDDDGELSLGSTGDELRTRLIRALVSRRITNLDTGQVQVKEGFEYLYTELLTMLGDDAYVGSFTARYDLADANTGAFSGSQFEVNGVDLAGAAGFEMELLYRAAQYYQAALDRFFELSPLLSRADFARVDVASGYFGRLVRASAQKARTWSEIARRYQDFNRPQLARRVIARAYTSTYLESVLVARLMRQVLEGAVPEERTQIERELEAGQRSYRSALSTMADIQKASTAEINVFGFSPDYVPFVALDSPTENAFDRLRVRALEKLNVSKTKDNEALARRRDFEVSAVQFRNELGRVDVSYDGQLGELCGTFQVSDGTVYPAIPEYSHLDSKLAQLGDPCGNVQNGQLFEARKNIGLAGLEISSLRKQFDNVVAEIEIEHDRVRRQCEYGDRTAEFRISQDEKSSTIWEDIDGVRARMDQLRYEQGETQNETARASACTPTISVSWPPSASFNVGACIGSINQLNQYRRSGRELKAKESQIRAKEQELRDLDLATALWEIEGRCTVAEIDSDARTKSLRLRLGELDLEGLKLDLRIALARAKVEELQNRAKRVRDDKARATQMLVDLESARNDPNVRIYKDEHILSAESAFDSAREAAYRVTAAFEYFTSQSYANKEDLFLARMASVGRPSLESYLEELFDAFDRFEEEYGNPELRVAIVSMRDDILAIPTLDESGAAIPHEERVSEFRRKLASSEILNGKGYIRGPFTTRAELVSPLTRNHKIHHVEAEVLGSAVGDRVGAVYLAQTGTSVVQSVAEEKRFYAFPVRTAVINAVFNGTRAFEADYYGNERLRDYPLLNTQWELLLNHRDEKNNLDIDLSSLSDIRIYFYYTDFTVF